MNIDILAVGTRPPAWVVEGFSEYTRRLPREWQLSVREIPVSKRRKGEPTEKNKQEEGKKMLAAISSGARVIALDAAGDIWSTEKLAQKMERYEQDYGHVQLLVGGPDGLAPECLARADDKWSLSRLTFPHFIVRILLAEQVYRAWSVLNNHPYHK